MTVLACRCPVTVVSGTAWAYNARMGWHDPVEHATWTPPTSPAASTVNDDTRGKELA